VDDWTSPVQDLEMQRVELRVRILDDRDQHRSIPHLLLKPPLHYSSSGFVVACIVSSSQYQGANPL
jgi:hypothetical protein